MTAIRAGVLRPLIPAVLALIGAASAFVATAAPLRAATPGIYTATLVAPLPTPKKVIDHGVLWSCAGNTCQAARDGSQAVMACTRLVMKVGPVARFAVAKAELASEDLARCNTDGS
jgi:hypothetical protein